MNIDEAIPSIFSAFPNIPQHFSKHTFCNSHNVVILSITQNFSSSRSRGGQCSHVPIPISLIKKVKKITAKDRLFDFVFFAATPPSTERVSGSIVIISDILNLIITNGEEWGLGEGEVEKGYERDTVLDSIRSVIFCTG